MDFAGLTDDQLNLVVFDSAEQLAILLHGLGIATSGDHIVDSAGSPEHCHGCGDALTTSNLGNVMPGSTLLFCDDPFCLSSYVAEHLPADDANSE